MTFSVEPTTTNVVVKANTVLELEDFRTMVKSGRSGAARLAHLTSAEVYWQFQEGHWRIDFIQVRGANVNKDGSDSRRELSEGTHPATESDRWNTKPTPPEIVAAALAHTPDWIPELSESGYESESDEKLLPQVIVPDLDDAGVVVTDAVTTTQVLIEARTVLRSDDFVAPVKARTALIKKSIVRWFFESGAWSLNSVHVWGPVIRQEDGEASDIHVSVLTAPASAGLSYLPPTPQPIVDAALPHIPTWIPTINESPYPRRTDLRSSV